jgi:alpha-L-rhamnosidase
MNKLRIKDLVQTPCLFISLQQYEVIRNYLQFVFVNNTVQDMIIRRQRNKGIIRIIIAVITIFIAGSYRCSAQLDLPVLKDYGLKEYVYTSKDLPRSEDKPWTLVCRLPYNAQFTTWIQLRSDVAGKTIRFDSTNPLTYCNQEEQSYTTVIGEQSYEMPRWISGEGARYTIPAGVTVLGVKYRETGYNTEFTGSFSCNDEDYNCLWKKATRTCYLCMRDHFMDCPDRERAEWLGDAVLQMEECFYAFDLSSHQIVRKFIRSGQINRLPGQNLIAHGEYGDWNYYLYTGDLETLKFIYSNTKEYLDSYVIGENGLPNKRNDGWDWYDWRRISSKFYIAALYSGHCGAG